MSTATTAGARDHARAQEGTIAEFMPTVPASAADHLPDDVDPSAMVWAETLPGGGYGHRVLAAGTHLQLTDLTGDACAGLVLYNAAGPHERLNVADTVKVQWQAYLGAGQLLLSDQARVLASIVSDTSGRHDTIHGVSTQARNERRYGDGAPEGDSPAGREVLAVAATKHGLDRRDLPPCVSLFQGVRVDADGAPVWLGSAGPGAAVTLRLEMACIVLIANTAHPLDPRGDYTVGPLRIRAWRGDTTSPDDQLWNHTPEGRRAFENTLDYRKGLL